MEGSYGDDIYLINLGDGHDIIRDNSYSNAGNKVVFGSEILASNVKLKVDTNNPANIILSINNFQSIIIENFTNNTDTVGLFQFADGTLWTRAEVLRMVGDPLNYKPASSAGDDILIGTSSNDTLEGAAGNDMLRGGSGSDNYLYKLGDGRDTIYDSSSASNTDKLVLSAGINPNDVAISVSPTDSRDLILTIGQGGGSIYLDQQLDGNGIERIEFADGTVWLASGSGMFTPDRTASGGGELIVGSALNETINGGGGNDVLRGNDGADTYTYSTGDGSDLIFDGGTDSAIDKLVFTGINSNNITLTVDRSTSSMILHIGSATIQLQDQISGGGYGIEQIIFGNGVTWVEHDLEVAYLSGVSTTGNDVIEGFIGSDIINGLAGNDILTGGSGADTYLFSLNQGNDVIIEEGYTGDIDQITFGVGIAASNIVVSNSNAAQGDLILSFNNGTGSITLQNQLAGSGAGVEKLVFNNGTIWGLADLLAAYYAPMSNSGNNIIKGLISNDIIYGNDGNDTIDGGAGDDALYGDNGFDNLNGAFGADTLRGGAGDDTLDGFVGSDTLSGEDGNDTLLGGTGDDILIGGLGNDTINGNDGVDTVSYVDSTVGVTVNLASSGAQSGGTAAGDIISNVENIIGTAYADNLSGNSGANVIDGGVGNDTVSYANSTSAVIVSLAITTAQSGGYAAGDVLSNIENIIGSNYNDTLSGNSAINNINGGTGTDTISYAGSSAAVTVNLFTNVNTGGYAASDTLSGIENIIGSTYNDTLSGTLEANNINGGAGVDTASYASSATGVTVNLTTNANTGGHADGDILTDVENITGSGFDDILTGLATGSILSGGAGADYLYGGAGNDMFIGGTGLDRIYGYGGIDTVSYSDSASLVNVNLTRTTGQFGGSATDDVFAFALIGGVNTCTIENIIGSNSNDTLTGNAISNVISGGLGNDVISGGDGNDILEGGIGADTLNGGNGIDTATYYNSTAAAVTVDLSLATAQSGGEAQGDILSNIENLTGSAYNDTLSGGSNNIANLIDGGAGNDTINGGVGNDTVTGGTGVDIFVINKDAGSSDIITDFSTSTVGEYISLLGFTGSVNFSALNISQSGSNTLIALENGQTITLQNVLASSLTAESFGQVGSITGTSGNDVLNGTSANDTINALAGNDLINGSAGNDTIDGGADTDTISYAASGSGVTVNLTTNVHSGGDAAGDTLSNIENIIGSASVDTLTARALGSVLEGGAGGDTITGGAGIDTVSYASSSAAVTVALNSSSNTGGDAAGDVLSGLENIIGSNYDDNFTGTSSANEINGGSGTDTVSYASSSAGVTVNLTLSGVQTSTGDASGDKLISIERIIGSALTDNLTALATGSILDGGAGTDTLNGGNGIDTLIGGSGVDTINGGDGDDSITGGTGGDIINGGNGIDTVSYADSASLVDVSLTRTGVQFGGSATDDVFGFILVNNVNTCTIENIIGSAYADKLAGNSVANRIDGGAGIDSMSYFNSTAAVTVDLSNNTTGQSGGFAAGDILISMENLTGSTYNDILSGDSVNNTITGSTGKDTITGGTGADTFRYSATTDSTAVAGTRDIITDFSIVQADKIDLSTLAGTFTFKGTGAFTGTANEVNYAQVSGNTIIGVDADGNGALDFQIELTGLHTLTSSDFLL